VRSNISVKRSGASLLAAEIYGIVELLRCNKLNIYIQILAHAVYAGMFFLIDFIAAGTRCLLQVLVLAHD
jgi:hypothetical protein